MSSKIPLSRYGSLTNAHKNDMFVRTMISSATTLVRARVPVARLKKVRGILSRMGTDTSGLINMVFAQVEINKGLPFPMQAGPVEDGYAYALREYGLSREEMTAFDADVDAEIEEARRNKTFREIA